MWYNYVRVCFSLSLDLLASNLEVLCNMAVYMVIIVTLMSMLMLISVVADDRLVITTSYRGLYVDCSKLDEYFEDL